jgi:hypothetical protein
MLWLAEQTAIRCTLFRKPYDRLNLIYTEQMGHFEEHFRKSDSINLTIDTDGSTLTDAIYFEIIFS